MTVDAPELHPIPVHSPWYHLGIDFVGPVAQSTNGNRYILTISDYFTKWVEAVALPSKHASGIANSLFKVSYLLNSYFVCFGIYYVPGPNLLKSLQLTKCGSGNIFAYNLCS